MKNVLHSDEDIAYVAGLFDGKGSINIARKLDKRNGRTIHCLELSLCQVSRKSLDLVMRLFKGCIKPARTPKGMLIWRYQCCTAQAETMLRDIRPYLLVKAEEADIALEFRDTISKEVGQKRPLTDEITNKRDELKTRLEGSRSEAR